MAGVMAGAAFHAASPMAPAITPATRVRSFGSWRPSAAWKVSPISYSWMFFTPCAWLWATLPRSPGMMLRRSTDWSAFMGLISATASPRPSSGMRRRARSSGCAKE